MAWWRGLLKVIFSILLVAALILFAMAFSVSKTITHDNLKPVFTDALKPGIQTNDANITLAYSNLVGKCANTTIETIELPLGEMEAGLGNITLKCADIKASTPQGMEDIIIGTVFDQKVYYKKYDCNFIDCLRNPPESVKGQEFMLLISDMASKFFRTYTNYLLIVAIVLILLIVLLSAPKYTALTTLGIDGIIAGLLYFIVNLAKTQITSIPAEAAPLLNQFFTSISQLFIILLVSGIVLLIAGIVIGIVSRKKKGKKKKRKEKEEEE